MPRRRESKGGTLAADHRGVTETVGHSVHPYTVTQEVTGAVPGNFKTCIWGEKHFIKLGRIWKLFRVPGKRGPDSCCCESGLGVVLHEMKVETRLPEREYLVMEPELLQP